MEKDIEKKKISFVEEILSLLEKKDYSEDSIKEAEKNLGLAEGYNYFLFPEGLNSIILYLEAYLDRKSLESLGTGPEKFSVTKTAGRALSCRIKIISKEARKRMLSYYAGSFEPITGLKASFASCDYIWRYLGDDSDDFNYYSKRILLSSVYKAGILFFLKDESEGGKDTDLFVDGSLKSIVNFGLSIKKLDSEEIIGRIPFLRLFF